MPSILTVFYKAEKIHDTFKKKYFNGKINTNLQLKEYFSVIWKR